MKNPFKKRFTFDEDSFKVDLVLYNRLLRSFVLIDLKIGKLKSNKFTIICGGGRIELWYLSVLKINVILFMAVLV